MTPERRRSVRVDVVTNGFVRVELRRRVRLLDISLSGALMACDLRVPVGSRGHLRMGLASAPFSADLTVCREHAPTRKLAHAGLGALFASMDENSRRSLEQFLRRASE
jgi:c-di-GMP-binding flagellar brake protein YcgR